MSIKRRFALALLAVLLAAGGASAQSSTFGSLSGTVTSDGNALPGVTVTVTSPALQGTRSTTTGESGGYLLKGLPPGEYQVTFEMQGFKTHQAALKISAAQDSPLNHELQLEGVTEEILVTGTYETIASTGQAATTYNYKQFVEKLPVNRNIRDAVLLTPGAAPTGPGQGGTAQISISGAPSYENLFLVNGVVVNENLRGQPFDLFIEDALEETTTSVSGVSAEYGRFTGGVVNAITKSGGNEFSGSLRVNLANDDWISKTELSPERIDKVNETYEATLGGFLWKDKLWFFAAGRDFEQTAARQTVITNVSYATGRDQQRYEGKLTLSPFQGHRLVATYLEIDDVEIGNRFTNNILDTASLNDRETPQELQALNYTGVITENFFVEAQYSERQFSFIGSGSRFTDRIKGTLFVDNATGNRWHSPTFCGVCRPEERDNTNLLAKGSYFLTSESLGTHDFAFGYDTYEDIRAADNHQSGSDFRIIINSTLVGADGGLFPVFNPNAITVIQWNPIFVSTRGSSFNTNSYFLNDRWRLNDHWSFNLGLRYDENDGQDQEGKTVAKDSRISPRLGLSYDPQGNGNWLFNASYGVYVAAIANNVADGTSRAGNPATFQWNYRGPAINVGGATTPADVALQQLWDWFDSVGGVNNSSFLRFVSIPGGTSAIKGGSLDSPYTEEFTVGTTRRLGSKGLVRADYVRREGHDFYSTRTDLSTGSTRTPTGSLVNFSLIENEDSLLERKYDGLHSQFQYRFSDRLSAGGNWTWSHARGNFDGETGPNATVSSGIRSFPEYKDLRWNNPRGDLAVDQRHRVRAWVLYDIWRNERNSLNVSVLQNYASGRPYAAIGSVDTRPFVPNPGYAIPPSTVAYFFSAPDAFTTPDITATDVAVNYAFRLGAFGQDIELFVQPEVFNVFNEDGFTTVNTAVSTRVNTTTLQAFNPFTTAPVEGVHWRKGANFGRPNNEFDYQAPRTFRLSVGVRF